jgi:hypothetical protein
MQQGTHTLDYEHYDFKPYMQCVGGKSSKRTTDIGFQVAQHPFFLENNEYYRTRKI